MTNVVWGRYEFDSDDVYISKNILKELELLAFAVENTEDRTEAVDDFYDLLGLLGFIEKLHDEEDAELKAEYEEWKESGGRPWDIGPSEWIG